MLQFPREKLTDSEKSLREFAMSFPEVTEEFPWGHRAFKVKKKIFATLTSEEGVTTLSTKLPKSHKTALKKFFATPTHYGLGKHGWVTFTFDSGDDFPMEDLRQWIRESFCAVAPKTVLKLLDDVEPMAANSKTRAKTVKKRK